MKIIIRPAILTVLAFWFIGGGLDGAGVSVVSPLRLIPYAVGLVAAIYVAVRLAQHPSRA